MLRSGSDAAPWELDAGMVVTGTMATAVDDCSDGWAGRAARVGIVGVVVMVDDNVLELLAGTGVGVAATLLLVMRNTGQWSVQSAAHGAVVSGADVEDGDAWVEEGERLSVPDLYLVHSVEVVFEYGAWLPMLLGGGGNVVAVMCIGNAVLHRVGDWEGAIDL